jgi:hypothetical protein
VLPGGTRRLLLAADFENFQRSRDKVANAIKVFLLILSSIAELPFLA